MADWVVRQRLRKIAGVSQVITMGGDRKQYHVLADRHLLHHFDVSLSEVEQALRASNENVTGGFMGTRRKGISDPWSGAFRVPTDEIREDGHPRRKANDLCCWGMSLPSMPGRADKTRRLFHQRTSGGRSDDSESNREPTPVCRNRSDTRSSGRTGTLAPMRIFDCKRLMNNASSSTTAFTTSSKHFEMEPFLLLSFCFCSSVQLSHDVHHT